MCTPAGARQVSCCTAAETESSDRVARIWDTETGKERAILKIHKTWVQHATFDREGRRGAVASAGSTARIWRAWPAGQELIDYARGMLTRKFRPDEGKRFFLTAASWNGSTGGAEFSVPCESRHHRGRTAREKRPRACPSKNANTPTDHKDGYLCDNATQ